MVANGGLIESKGRGKNLKERETWETECREWESQEEFFLIFYFIFLQLSYSCTIAQFQNFLQ